MFAGMEPPRRLAPRGRGRSALAVAVPPQRLGAFHLRHPGGRHTRHRLLLLLRRPDTPVEPPQQHDHDSRRPAKENHRTPHRIHRQPDNETQPTRNDRQHQNRHRNRNGKHDQRNVTSLEIHVRNITRMTPSVATLQRLSLGPIPL